MRGDDLRDDGLFSYLSLEQRVPQDHPLRRLRALVDPLLKALSPRFSQMYARVGRPSIAPEKLLRALLLQGLYSIRSERLWVEQLDYKCAGINRSEAEDERALRERSSDPLGLEFCTVASRGVQRSVNRGIGGQGY